MTSIRTTNKAKEVFPFVKMYMYIYCGEILSKITNLKIIFIILCGKGIKQNQVSEKKSGYIHEFFSIAYIFADNLPTL